MVYRNINELLEQFTTLEKIHSSDVINYFTKQNASTNIITFLDELINYDKENYSNNLLTNLRG